MTTKGLGIWLQLRQLVSERIIAFGFSIMPAKHPHSLIWARALGQAAAELIRDEIGDRS